ncbi:MAG TPA: hypothetical protein VKZ84_08120 [Bacteriovoracaceae bacterium]|nr:hypothetical protein [Bacteriovoracaceae bacterium]
MNKLFGWFSLFTSFGTLICCAIPSLLVIVGLGSVVAGVVGEYPQFVWLSEHKAWIFTFSISMLIISQVMQRLTIKKNCDDGYCEVTKSWAKPIWWATLSINLIGLFWAYVLPQLV